MKPRTDEQTLADNFEYLNKKGREATSHSFFYICRRLQSVELLQWLRAQ
ncbi:hypothetical protein [Agriterribacter sp.]|nr:hypothetical protein [Agriterribacter sp.]HTN07811.1 hypothetical protein [Agriterribacter sp.]